MAVFVQQLCGLCVSVRFNTAISKNDDIELLGVITYQEWKVRRMKIGM